MGSFSPDQRHICRDTEKLLGDVAERPDATVLLVAKSRSISNVGCLHRKWAVSLTSNMVGWFGKFHHVGGEGLWSTI